MLSFENTEVAFTDKTVKQLKRALLLFLLLRKQWVVKIGSFFLLLFNRLHLPLKWALKNTVFDHFCGGETIEESQKVMRAFAANNIKTVLDYSAEGLDNEESFEKTKDQIIASIEFSKYHKEIAFAVFKFTGIARFELLEKVNSGVELHANEQSEFQRIRSRADEICHTAVQNELPVMIDAEESWIQNTIDELVESLMSKYNHEKPYVFTTIQLYRIDKLFYLKKMHKNSFDAGFIPAFKLVRGAYMEKERERAARFEYTSPIHPDKLATDKAFDEAVRYCLENKDTLAVCIGTHNEESCLDAIHLMDIFETSKDHKKVHFSQLMGMSDHISYNMAKEGFNVSKYVPFGPLKMVMPYLIRRAEENSSVADQSGRELYLIRQELKRRREER